MSKDIKQFIKAAKRERLSENERSILRSKLIEFISFNPIRGALPKLSDRNYISVFEVRAFVKASALLLIIAVVAGGSGVSYAAQNSLPGETLYSIKVNVNEAIEEGLARTPEARVAVQSKQVERRLEEAQTLAKTDKLSKENEKIVIDKIEDHIKDLEKGIEELREDGRADLVLETTAKLTPVMEAHKEILEKNSADTENPTDDEGDLLIAKVEDGIKAVENEETMTLAAITPPTADPAVATMAMTLAKAEDIQSDLKRDAKETINEINDQIENLVKSRLDSAEQKIREIKELREQTVTPQVVVPAPKPTDTIAPTTKEIVVDEINEKQSEDTPSPTPTTVLTSTIETPAIDEDELYIESRLAAADEMLTQAKELMKKESWKEALSLAQDVNRIASEIETFIHLKKLELADDAAADASMKASVTNAAQ